MYKLVDLGVKHITDKVPYREILSGVVDGAVQKIVDQNADVQKVFNKAFEEMVNVQFYETLTRLLEENNINTPQALQQLIDDLLRNLQDALHNDIHDQLSQRGIPVDLENILSNNKSKRVDLINRFLKLLNFSDKGDPNHEIIHGPMGYGEQSQKRTIEETIDYLPYVNMLGKFVDEAVARAVKPNADIERVLCSTVINAIDDCYALLLKTAFHLTEVDTLENYYKLCDGVLGGVINTLNVQINDRLSQQGLNINVRNLLRKKENMSTVQEIAFSAMRNDEFIASKKNYLQCEYNERLVAHHAAARFFQKSQENPGLNREEELAKLKVRAAKKIVELNTPLVEQNLTNDMQMLLDKPELAAKLSDSTVAYGHDLEALLLAANLSPRDHVDPLQSYIDRKSTEALPSTAEYVKQFIDSMGAHKYITQLMLVIMNIEAGKDGTHEKIEILELYLNDDESHAYKTIAEFVQDLENNCVNMSSEAIKTFFLKVRNTVHLALEKDAPGVFEEDSSSAPNRYFTKWAEQEPQGEAFSANYQPQQ